MKIIICENYDELSEKAFEVMKGVVTGSDRPVLGLATGSSPIGLYKCMIKDHKENGTDYSKVITFNLDEYVGLKSEHSKTYYTLGNGDLEKNCADYEKAMEDYTVDIQLLGIGSNGHIGFNEPGTSFDSLTHVVELKESTRKDNARFFDPLGEEVPTHACTMGIATIMKAKKILVVANGANKADAVFNMVKGPVSEDCPASILQNHPDVTLIVDRAAGKKL